MAEHPSGYLNAPLAFRFACPSTPVAAPPIIPHPTPIIDAERLPLLPRAIGHQPPQQLGHLYIPTMLPLEGLHIELLAPLT